MTTVESYTSTIIFSEIYYVTLHTIRTTRRAYTIQQYKQTRKRQLLAQIVYEIPETMVEDDSCMLECRKRFDLLQSY